MYTGKYFVQATVNINWMFPVAKIRPIDITWTAEFRFYGSTLLNRLPSLLPTRVSLNTFKQKLIRIFSGAAVAFLMILTPCRSALLTYLRY